MHSPFSKPGKGYLDRVSTGHQISLLLAMLAGGVGLVAVISIAAVTLIRGEILHLSGKISPTQVKLAKLERGFEQIDGYFTRVSAAASDADIATIDGALDRTLREVRAIDDALGASAGSQKKAIRAMRKTGEQLSRIAREKIEARTRIQQATRNVTDEIGTVTSITQNLSAAMSALRGSSQRALLSSKETSLDANLRIRLLLIEREELAQLRSCVREAGMIDKKFRLNLLRGTSDSILDTMKANMSGEKLSAELRQFVDRFSESYGGSAGLLAARTAMLAKPGDEKLRAAYQARQGVLTKEIDELSRRTVEEIDPLDLAVVKTNARINRAVELTSQVSSVSHTDAEISDRSRSLQALAWRFLAETDVTNVDRTMGDVAEQTDHVNSSLRTLEKNFSDIDQPAPLSSLHAAHQAFARVREVLIGPSGVAVAVKLGILKQAEAETLLNAALGSIRTVALIGASRAGDAEAAESRSLERIRDLAAGAFFIVGVVSLGALLTGGVVGDRVRSGILKSEKHQLRLKNELRERTLRDPLTNLPNRRLIGDLLAQSIEDASAQRNQLAIFCVDLDRFKQVNDRLGHRIGDLYLIEVARRMEQAIGPAGVVARIGGDEFTVLLPGVDTGEVVKIAGRLLDALSIPALIENCPLQAGCSIGIARFPVDGTSAETLLKNADQAMYRAKNSGRNRFSLFDWQISKSAEEREEIQELLRTALEKGEFRIKYQPQYNVEGRVTCLEALLRFHHPSFGDISPARFIPIAEESGLIVPIGDWVLREVARQSLVWQKAGLRPIRIGVNVSALQLAQANFFDSVQELLEQTGLPPELLELEITETLIMSHLDETQRLIVRLRSLGLHVSIDDFGTGYSSLSYLHKLPVDTIKIDQSFIRDVHSDTSTLPLIQAITSAAHAFGLSVVAEGVETNLQMQALADIGCDRMQGYLFARPLDAEDAERLLGDPNAQPAAFRNGQRRLPLIAIPGAETRETSVVVHAGKRSGLVPEQAA